MFWIRQFVWGCGGEIYVLALVVVITGFGRWDSMAWLVDFFNIYGWTSFPQVLCKYDVNLKLKGTSIGWCKRLRWGRIVPWSLVWVFIVLLEVLSVNFRILWDLGKVAFTFWFSNTCEGNCLTRTYFVWSSDIGKNRIKREWIMPSAYTQKVVSVENPLLKYECCRWTK